MQWLKYLRAVVTLAGVRQRLADIRRSLNEVISELRRIREALEGIRERIDPPGFRDPRRGRETTWTRKDAP